MFKSNKEKKNLEKSDQTKEYIERSKTFFIKSLKSIKTFFTEGYKETKKNNENVCKTSVTPFQDVHDDWDLYRGFYSPFCTIVINLSPPSLEYLHCDPNYQGQRIRQFLEMVSYTTTPSQTLFLMNTSQLTDKHLDSERCEKLIRALFVDQDRRHLFDKLKNDDYLCYPLYFKFRNETQYTGMTTVCKKLKSQLCIFYIIEHRDWKTNDNGELQDYNSFTLDKIESVEHQILQTLFPQHLLEDIVQNQYSDLSHHSRYHNNVSINRQSKKGGSQSGHNSKSFTEDTTTILENAIYPTSDADLFHKCPSLTRRNSLNIRSSLEIEQSAREFNDVVILFLDIVGFTHLASRISPKNTMYILNKLFSAYDELTNKHDVYKVETAGDCYIVCDGIFKEQQFPLEITESQQRFQKNDCPRRSCVKMLRFAQELIETTRALRFRCIENPVKIRIGMHIGNVVTGNVGTKLPKFSMFGDVMNVASRMESTSSPNCVQVTKDFYSHVPDLLQWKRNPDVVVKNRGVMETYIAEL